jgi:D-alanyl-D-alanine carboxypeptidase
MEVTMKKILTFVISFSLIFLNISNFKIYAKDNPPSASADSVVLMDAATGDILYGKNPDTPYPPASTTKLMTALLTLEKGNLDDIVTIGKNPPHADGSKIYLYEGEKIKVRDLLYGLLLVSGNDCAEALAEYIGGTQDNFVVEMNKRALELGAKDTHFVNPSGLYNDKHRTSARDLALIMRELSKHPEYTQIATTSFYKIPPTNKSKLERPLWNENRLIQKSSQLYYKWCEGGKTGYTIQSEHSYVATATKNGQKLIVVFLHDNGRAYFSDAINLFNYGFNNFDTVKLFSKGDLVTTYSNNGLNIPLLAAEDFYYVKEKGSTSVPKYTINNKNLSLKFFKTGDIVTDASVSLDNKSIGTLKLMSGSTHEFKQVFQFPSFQNIALKSEYLAPLVLGFLGIAIFVIKKFNLFSRNL